MNIRSASTWLRFVIPAAILVACIGCEPKGPAQKAGEAVDRGVQDVKDAIDPPGPVEKAARSVDRAVNP